MSEPVSLRKFLLAVLPSFQATVDVGSANRLDRCQWRIHHVLAQNHRGSKVQQLSTMFTLDGKGASRTTNNTSHLSKASYCCCCIVVNWINAYLCSRYARTWLVITVLDVSFQSCLRSSPPEPAFRSPKWVTLLSIFADLRQKCVVVCIKTFTPGRVGVGLQARRYISFEVPRSSGCPPKDLLSMLTDYIASSYGCIVLATILYILRWFKNCKVGVLSQSGYRLELNKCFSITAFLL